MKPKKQKGVWAKDGESILKSIGDVKKPWTCDENIVEKGVRVKLSGFSKRAQGGR